MRRVVVFLGRIGGRFGCGRRRNHRLGDHGLGGGRDRGGLGGRCDRSGLQADKVPNNKTVTNASFVLYDSTL